MTIIKIKLFVSHELVDNELHEHRMCVKHAARNCWTYEGLPSYQAREVREKQQLIITEQVTCLQELVESQEMYL